MTDEELQREMARWERWVGVTGTHYARRLKSSPPVVIRAESRDELRSKVQEYIAGRPLAAADGTWPGPPWE